MQPRLQPTLALLSLAFVAASVAASACGTSDPSTFKDGGTGDTSGGATAGSTDGTSGGASGVDFGDAGGASGGGTAASDTLSLTIRDFKLYAAADSTTNPDFENVPKTDAMGNPNAGYAGPWDDLKIVTENLGADGKPVYLGDVGGKTLTTHGKDAFDQWYRNVPGVNVTLTYPLKLTKTGDVFEFDSQKTGVPLSGPGSAKMFFPIDDGSAYSTAFGNQSDPHNYCFTTELHTKFSYKGGEFFDFRGDDDVFVYVAGVRRINLGGIHGPSPARIEIDTLGLTKGQEYPLDFFSAERHKTGSNILFTTTLDLRPSDIN